MFREERDELKFQWSMLGDIKEGRPNLGYKMDVIVYRLMQFTLRDVMIKEFGVEKADELFYLSGKKSGEEFYKNILTKKGDFSEFAAELQEKLKELQIGILRIEKADTDKMEFVLTVAEDLDCSGLPVSGEEVCTYDEGFLAGIMESFTGKPYNVKEVDCWASGDRVCRFDVKQRRG